MKLDLTFEEIDSLKQLCSNHKEITFRIDISKEAINYCKKLMEINFKTLKNLLPKSARQSPLNKDSLYKKLKEAKNAKKQINKTKADRNG